MAEARDELVISDVETLKAITDPLRLKLIEIASKDPKRSWTAKELAERLETKQTKLYHHLALLEERGFLRVAETRLVSGIQEKRYAATAHSFRVERQLLSSSDEGTAAVNGILDAVFDKARTEIAAGIRAGAIDPTADAPEPRSMALSIGGARLSRASARKIVRLIEKVAAMGDQDDADGSEYGLVIGFYPKAPEKDADR